MSVWRSFDWFGKHMYLLDQSHLCMSSPVVEWMALNHVTVWYQRVLMLVCQHLQPHFWTDLQDIPISTTIIICVYLCLCVDYTSSKTIATWGHTPPTPSIFVGFICKIPKFSIRSTVWPPWTKKKHNFNVGQQYLVPVPEKPLSEII